MLAAGLVMAALPAHAQGLASGTVTADYQAKLAQYQLAHGAYEAEASAYWDAVAEKRRQRVAKRRGKDAIVLQDYVLTQPPVYTGPPPPVDPSAPPEEPQPRKYVPVVADFLQAAARELKFVPQHPQSEIEYKRAYARVAAVAGLTKEQVVRIYAFESGAAPAARRNSAIGMR